MSFGITNVELRRICLLLISHVNFRMSVSPCQSGMSFYTDMCKVPYVCRLVQKTFSRMNCDSELRISEKKMVKCFTGQRSNSQKVLKLLESKLHRRRKV